MTLCERPPPQTQARLQRALGLLAQTRPAFSARRRLTRGQWQACAVLTAVLALLAIAAPLSMAVAVNALFLAYCCAIVGSRLWMLHRSWQIPTPARRRVTPLAARAGPLPVVTLLVPLYRETASLPGLVEALGALDYPTDRLDIKIVLEADDDETIASARRLCRDPHYDLVIVPACRPRTKPKALSYALQTARGTITAVYDAEDRPQPDQLREAVAAFAAAAGDGDGAEEAEAGSRAPLACVQARLNYYNRDRNWLTGLFAMEYAFLFDIVLPVLSHLGAPIPLGGTSNFFRTDILRAVGGWDPYNVTEDADLGFRLAADGYRVGMIASTTYEEAVASVPAWIRQRSRWIKGYIQTWFVHVRAHEGKPVPFSRAWRARTISLHLVLGSTVVTAIVNPLFWGLYALWAFGLMDGIARFHPSPLIELSFATLLAGNFLIAYMTMLAPMRRHWYAYCGLIALMPAYWAMMCAAGYIALWQFLTRPFYWDKTEHGLAEETPAVPQALYGQEEA